MNRRLCLKFAAGSLALASFPSLQAASREIVMYSNFRPEAIEQMLKIADKELPELKISWIRAGAGALMKRLQAEGKNPKADIYWAGSFATIANYPETQASYHCAEEGAVEPQYRGENGRWLGVNQCLSVLLAHMPTIRDGILPKTWADLGHPRYKNKVVFHNPATSGTAYATLFAIRSILPPEDYARLVRNLFVSGGSIGAFEMAARGEFPLGLTIENQAYEYIAGGQKNLKMIYPEDGVVVIPEGMFIVKNGPNPEAAKKLFDLLASKPFQEKLFQTSFIRPLRKDISSAGTGLPELSSLKLVDVDFKEGAAKRQEVIAEFEEIRKTRGA